MKQTPRLKTLVSSVALLVPLTVNVSMAAVVYQESFTGQNGKGAVGPVPTIDVSGVSWNIDVSATSLTAADDFFQVVNEQFVGQDLDGPATWISPAIDISAFTDVGISLDAEEVGDHEALDYLNVLLSVDGGASTLIANFNGLGDATHTLFDDFGSQTVTHLGLSGSTLQLTVEMLNNAGTERLILDNIVFTGTPISSPQVPEPSSTFVFTGLGVMMASRIWRRRKPR